MRLESLLVLGCAACVASGGHRVAVDPAALDAGPHEATVNGARLHYRVGGSAPADVPPVLFVHGLGAARGSEHVDALAGSYLEPRLRMVYFDLRGSGLSERPVRKDYRLRTLIGDLEAVRRRIGAPKIALVGFEFGSALAMEYAARHPDRVSHLILVSVGWDTPLQCQLRLERFAASRPDAYARVRGDTLDEQGKRRSDCDLEFRSLAGNERETYMPRLLFPDPSVQVRIDSVNRARGIGWDDELVKALFAQGLRRYRLRAFDRLTMPVLVVAGRLDGVALPEGQRELTRRLPHARYLEFDRAGHYPHLDDPERFARELAAFIRP